MNLARYIEPPRRRCLMRPEGEVCRTWVAPVVECHFIFGGDTTEQIQNDRSVAATDSNIATESGVSVQSGAIGVGAGGQFNEAGAIGDDLTITGNVSISNTDKELALGALEIYRDLAGQTNAVLADAGTEAHFLAGKATSALEEIKAAELTGGASVWRSSIIIISLGALAVMAIKFWKGR